MLSQCVLALGTGWGRAGVMAAQVYTSWPSRYTHLDLPILLAAFFAFEFYASRRLANVIQTALFLIMCLLIPVNTVQGVSWGAWYLQSVDPALRDAAAGMPIPTLAERHLSSLKSWGDATELADLMGMLKGAGMGAFANLPDKVAAQERPAAAVAIVSPPTAQEIRYSLPSAGEIFLIWGVNGWQALAGNSWPPGTRLINNRMQTPMLAQGNTFSVRLKVPRGTRIDYGFLITKYRDGTGISPVWEARPHYWMIASGNSVTDLESPLVLLSEGPVWKVSGRMVTQEVRYHASHAGEVALCWGLGSWHPVPRDLRPAGTVMRNKMMNTPMVRNGDTFVAKLRVPSGARVDYGFLITKGRGLFDIPGSIWDGRPEYVINAAEDGIIDAKTPVPVGNTEVSALARHALPILIALAGWGTIWLALYLLLALK